MNTIGNRQHGIINMPLTQFFQPFFPSLLSPPPWHDVSITPSYSSIMKYLEILLFLFTNTKEQIIDKSSCHIKRSIGALAK